MCASFAPLKPPQASFTVGKAGHDSAGPSRRRINSSGLRSRSPSPSTHESLSRSSGHRGFSNRDGAGSPPPIRLVTSGERGGGAGAGGRSFRAIAGSPASLNRPLQARSGEYSFNHSSTSPSSRRLPPLSPSGGGHERPATATHNKRSSPAPTSGGGSADAGTNAAGTTKSTPTTTKTTTTATTTAIIPTFSEIMQGVNPNSPRGSAAEAGPALEPFARAQVKAAEVVWERREAERQERDKRWRVRVLSVATLLVLVVVLACRCTGFGIKISGPAGTRTALPPPPPEGKNNSGGDKSSLIKKSSPPPSSPSQGGGGGGGGSGSGGAGGFLTSALGEMPAIVSSRDELVAVLELAGVKKYKPAQVDRAWSALASGETRNNNDNDNSSSNNAVGALGMYYVRGGVLAARVAVAGVLRNPDFGVVLLAVALATVVAFSRGSSWWRNLDSGGGGNGKLGRAGWQRAGGGGSTNGGSRSPRGAGVRDAEGWRRRGGGAGSADGNRCGVEMRDSSAVSPRQQAGS
ncbi:unnamed protein product [Pylaiella littoralis]